MKFRDAKRHLIYEEFKCWECGFDIRREKQTKAPNSWDGEIECDFCHETLDIDKNGYWYYTCVENP